MYVVQFISTCSISQSPPHHDIVFEFEKQDCGGPDDSHAPSKKWQNKVGDTQGLLVAAGTCLL